MIKERGWEIDTKGKDKYALHRALKAYCDENKVYVKDSDKPKKASMKQFTTEILKTACQARGLKGSGKKVELEERLFGWEGHADLASKKEKCFFCLDAFAGTDGATHCPRNCGAGLDFATCGACVVKLCGCQKIANKKAAADRMTGGMYYGEDVDVNCRIT